MSSYSSLIGLSSSATLITAAFKLLKNTHPHMHTNTFRLRTHCLITGANLVKTITELIESSLVDECIKHAHTNTHPHTEDESLQGHGYLLSHFSYHLGFVNSQWGGNAISGAAHSSLRLVKEKKKRARERERESANPHSSSPSFMTKWLPHEVTLRGKPIYYSLFPTMTVVWVFSYGDSDAEEILKLQVCACWVVHLSQ